MKNTKITSKTNHGNVFTKFFFLKSYSKKIQYVLGDIESIKLIDIGAGYGHFSLAASRLGAIVDALEPRPECQVILNSIKIANLYNDKMHSGTLTANYYDIAVLISVIDEVEDKYSFMSDVVACVKQCGYILIEVRNTNYFNRLRSPLHTDIASDEYLTLFNSFGLELVHFSGVCRPLTFGSFEIFLKTLFANIVNFLLPLKFRQMHRYLLMKK
jgi:2-polyprenyl-3-methyl-5-hydroxy-6-metoxy-1,4-benzoquinol methylase